MITLITGTPGSGKTAYALDMMLRAQKLDNSRQLYVHGIPDLRVTHQIVICTSTSCDCCMKLDNSTGKYLLAENWYDWSPQGAILFFDEVQNIHRPRGSGAAVPPCVAAYEVHRHKGLDFFFITQNPLLIDSNIRVLVSRHIHLTATWARRLQHEWSQCKTDLSCTVGDSIESTYKLPKEVFDLYKSASTHTKVQRKRPIVLYFLPVLIVFIVVLAVSFQRRMSSAAHPVHLDAKDFQQNTAGGGMGGGVPPRGTATAVTSVNLNKQVLNMPVLFRKWSQFGIRDDELKFLPVTMCVVSSATLVRCEFSATISFRKFFSNILCDTKNCFSFIARLPFLKDEHRQNIDSSVMPSVSSTVQAVIQSNSQPLPVQSSSIIDASLE